MGRTAEGDRLREQAAAHRQEAADSFERCDTDGFLSQWASGLNAQLAELNARIADHGGRGVFRRWRLADAGTGAIVEDARQVQTRFGTCWRIDRTNEWLPVKYGEGTARAKLVKAGYAEVQEFAEGDAKAILWGTGTGLSGAHTVRAIVIRTDAEKRDGWIFDGFGEEE